MAKKPVQETDHWALDKRLPISMLVAMAINVGAGVWWAAGINKDIAAFRDQLLAQQLAWRSEIGEIKAGIKELSGSKDRVNTLEVEMRGIRDTLTRVERLIERVTERNSWEQTQRTGGKRQ